MIENDTIKLLRECDAGIKMGVEAIDEVLPKVVDKDFKNILSENRRKHIDLQNEINEKLKDYQDDGKEPPLIAEIMSKMKTGLKMLIDPTDNAIADLITDGGNMGVKSLNRYLNQYKASDENSKDFAKKLIDLEDSLVRDVRKFL
jgi:hypothetical protein